MGLTSTISFSMTSLQRLDRYQRRAHSSPIPIHFEFRPMRCRPFHNHTQHTMRQVPNEHGSRVDLQYSPMLAVPHVEVRWRMIVVIHRHDDTEESTDLGHPEEPAAPGARTC